MSLRLDWCSHAAAKYAVEHWHYSRTMPAGKNVYIGVWERDRFIGVIIFGNGGGNATNGKRFGLSRAFEMAELVRVALREHEAPVSRIVGIALKMLKRQSPQLRLVISFADPYRGHCGGIYQAGNWTYAGPTKASKLYIDKAGREFHERVVSPAGIKKQYGVYKPCLRPDGMRMVEVPGKYTYLMPLDKEMRERIAPLAKPYPKKTCAGSVDGGASPDQGEGGGSIPTPALQNERP